VKFDQRGDLISALEFAKHNTGPQSIFQKRRSNLEYLHSVAVAIIKSRKPGANMIIVAYGNQRQRCKSAVMMWWTMMSVGCLLKLDAIFRHSILTFAFPRIYKFQVANGDRYRCPP